MKGNQCKRSLIGSYHLYCRFLDEYKNNNFTCFLHVHQFISKQMKSVVVFLYIALRQAWVYFASMERSLLPLKWFIILRILSRSLPNHKYIYIQNNGVNDFFPINHWTFQQMFYKLTSVHSPSLIVVSIFAVFIVLT